MNKFVIGIKLKENFELEINIIHWDQRFLFDETATQRSCYDFYNVDKFMIYSFDHGYMCDDEFVVPEKKYYNPCTKLSYNFDTEDKRYNFLKNLYNCLNEWGKCLNDSLRDKELITIENIIVNGEYWLM